MNTKFLTMIALVLCGFSAVPDRVITGTVSDENNDPMPGVNVTLKGTSTATSTNATGRYSIMVPDQGGVLVFSFIGYVSQEIKVKDKSNVDVRLVADVQSLSEVVITGYGRARREEKSARPEPSESRPYQNPHGNHRPVVYDQVHQQPNTEEYKGLEENAFHEALTNPLSTFSIDVDAASYSNMRRFINNGQLPPKEAVRIEEMVNYFSYKYEQPKGSDPFSVHTEISSAPWNTKHKLVHIGIQGKKIPVEKLPPANLVFLIDVSGSMNDPNKLPLLKTSFKMLVDQLRDKDHVSIVVYAGAAGVVLKPTPGSEKQKIVAALDQLSAGGSTAGGAGIQLAYATAKENFNKEGNNRVILATDGDFNVGVSSEDELEKLIESKRKEGVFLTVLGFGTGNYKDAKMEVLADKGNGNYAYIDNLSEARKVFVNEFGGTLFTIAKDVKLQIEFNPTRVKAYRLIGYENRMLKSEDFNNDKKDAGDLGSGHTVTALYEVVPVGVDSDVFSVDDLKYQKKKMEIPSGTSNEILTLKLRYKKPDEEVSSKIVHALIDESVPVDKTSDNFRWSASVASFGMLLRESALIKDFSVDQAIALAKGAKGEDPDGYRIEFINLMKSAKYLNGNLKVSQNGNQNKPNE